MEYRMNVPLNQADLEVLRAGDVVYCSGVIYTARDAAHARFERMLNAGETLSQFVEQAAVQAAQRRQAQQAFVARGRAALVRAQQTGVLHDADETLAAMRARLGDRVAALRRS